eukprot:gnl/TRDRNA2_/TRDRNA2_175045_c4_seq3.p1 gnl/TRDRNA2_/TRDRNA2_175045_c4~~gnl/TRDRNA2_/TRDRNA2_175045_c4_seq3.p1  ORF type:complete len:219 (+),score=62.36 gnl/TRDRNA2_/TRDRNA2_175045_c4_seq3:1-657(+)
MGSRQEKTNQEANVVKSKAEAATGHAMEEQSKWEADKKKADEEEEDAKEAWEEANAKAPNATEIVTKLRRELEVETVKARDAGEANDLKQQLHLAKTELIAAGIVAVLALLAAIWACCRSKSRSVQTVDPRPLLPSNPEASSMQDHNFYGRWVDESDNVAVATIAQNVVKWEDGTETNFVVKEGEKIFTEVDEQIYQGKLDERGRLVWCDGEIWLRAG